MLREAHDIYEKSTTPIRTPWYRPDVQSTLGAALAGLKEFGEAEPLLLSGYEGLRDLPDTPAAHLRMAMERLVEFYVVSGRPEEAVAWRNRLNGVTAAAPSAATSARR